MLPSDAPEKQIGRIKFPPLQSQNKLLQSPLTREGAIQSLGHRRAIAAGSTTTTLTQFFARAREGKGEDEVFCGNNARALGFTHPARVSVAGGS